MLLRATDPETAAKHAASVQVLTDLTLARIARESSAGINALGPNSIATLHSDDAESLDAFITAGFKTSKVPSTLRDRAARVERSVSLVTSDPGISASPDLLQRTLFSIDSYESTRGASPITMPRRRPSGLRLADLVSVAAVLIVGVAVAWPLLSALKTHSAQMACGGNLATVANAMGIYGGDYRDQLPIASASLVGSTWWDVGKGAGHSNSANLFALPKANYTNLESLACSGNEHAVRNRDVSKESDWRSIDEISYSYYVMFGKTRPNFHTLAPETVILADRSPVIQRAMHNEPIVIDENSPNHRGEGQWALRTDGSASWLSTPMHGDDNIWLPAAIEDLVRQVESQIRAGKTSGVVVIKGSETPGGPQESFLAP